MIRNQFNFLRVFFIAALCSHSMIANAESFSPNAEIFSLNDASEAVFFKTITGKIATPVVSDHNAVNSQVISIHSKFGDWSRKIKSYKSARSIARILNNPYLGVTAFAVNRVILSVPTPIGGGVASFYLNDEIFISASVTSYNHTQLADEINAVTAMTGISAYIDENNAHLLILQNDGEDISFSRFSSTGDPRGAWLSITGPTGEKAALYSKSNDVITVGGVVTLASAAPLTVTSDDPEHTLLED
jgi:hypothetical protein